MTPKFTIDFVGLLNSQKIPVDQLAKRTGLLRDRVRKHATGDPPRYARLTAGIMLQALGVQPYPPFYLEDTDEGPRLSVDWDGLLKLHDAKMPWLVKKTKLRRHLIYAMIFRDLASFDRETLGTTLNVLNVSCYPPFFIEGIPGEPTYEPARAEDYYRARSPDPDNG